MRATLIDRTQIHVDDYKYRLYHRLSHISDDANPDPEGSALIGFPCANHRQAGCLTRDQNVRLHSCECGTGCPVLDKAATVHITPVLSISATGDVLLEKGAGGGAQDLIQTHSLELDSKDIVSLTKLCSVKVSDKETRLRTLDYISNIMLPENQSLSFNALQLGTTTDSIPLERVALVLARLFQQDSRFVFDATNDGQVISQNDETNARDTRHRVIVREAQIDICRNTKPDL